MVTSHASTIAAAMLALSAPSFVWTPNTVASMKRNATGSSRTKKHNRLNVSRCKRLKRRKL